MVTEQAHNLNGISGAGTGLTIPAAGKVLSASISVSGTIALTGASADIMGTAGITVTMTPSWNPTANTVVWSCEVAPIRFGPSSCRTD